MATRYHQLEDVTPGLVRCTVCGRTKETGKTAAALNPPRGAWSGCPGPLADGEEPPAVATSVGLSVQLLRRPEREVAAYEPPADLEGPSLWKQARNFAIAMKKRLRTGSKNVTAETYGARAAICEQCPAKLRKGNKCFHPDCGCNLAVKLQWSSEACPLGHWLAVETGKPVGSDGPRSKNLSGCSNGTDEGQLAQLVRAPCGADHWAAAVQVFRR